MKIFLDSVGCRLNQSEIETYGRQFRGCGHILVANPEEADLVVINTCTVTAAADADSRKKIRQAANAGGKDIIVTGCWSSLHPTQATAFPAVSKVIHNTYKDTLVSQILQLPEEDFDLEPLVREPIPGPRSRTRAFIKVQDGCDNHCTFCITTIARGSGRSRSLENILSEVQSISRMDDGHNAVKEIILTGVHLGSWGHDFSPRQQLHHLVQTILRETDIPRIRLSSLEPWDLDDAFFSLWENPRICRQIHVPLQSGCQTTLRRMARKITPDEYAHLIQTVREVCSEIAITTDIITGFPGESDYEFKSSLNFVKKMQFANGHVFTFSARPGTAAASMPNQIPHSLRKERNAHMRAALADLTQAYQSKFINKTLRVLWESSIQNRNNGWQLKGLTDNYLRISATSSKNLWNQITPVRLTTLSADGIFGEISTP